MSLRHIDNLNNTDTIEQSVLLYLENSLEWPSTFISRKKPAETSIRKNRSQFYFYPYKVSPNDTPNDTTDSEPPKTRWESSMPKLVIIHLEQELGGDCDQETMFTPGGCGTCL